MKKALLAIVATVSAGCMTTAPELTAWRMARDVNTPAAYEDFNRRYPGSDHADEARELIAKSKTERIAKASTVAECVAVMKTAPDAKTAAAISETAFKAAQKETSPEGLQLFLANFGGHAGAPEVRARLEEIEFQGAGKSASPAAMEYFLYRYPGSRFSAEGRKILAEKTYQQVKAWGSPYGYKAFLLRFPDSPRAAEIRASVRTAPPQAGPSNVQAALAEAGAKSPSLKKHACALALSAAIAGKSGDVDALRARLHELEKGAGPGQFPEMCATAGLKARPGAEGALAEALQSLARVEELRKDLAGKWEVCKQRDEIVKAAVTASANVANDLETAELSEEVLGTGPLGRLETGAEKGSVSAKKALERFKSVQSITGRDRDEIKRLLLEADGVYRPLQAYAISSVEAR